MPLSGPDNTRLEVREYIPNSLLTVTQRTILVFHGFMCHPVEFGILNLQALVHDIYSELVDDACLGLCFEVHRAVKQGYFFLDETDQESMKEFGWCHVFQFLLPHMHFPLVCILTAYAFFYYSSRNCGSARRGHIWPSVQSVEKQRVRVPKLQKIDSSFSLCPAFGEMSRHGTKQQSHCKPQVGKGHSEQTLY